MVQLIIDGFTLPESKKGGYSAALVPLSVDVEMISGRVVREVRGYVWEISYQYGYFNDEEKNQILSILKKGQSQPITCGFLMPDSSGALMYSDFWVAEFNYPKFMWSVSDLDADPVPMWANFSFSLREVKPSD